MQGNLPLWTLFFLAHCYHVNRAVSVTGLVIQHGVSSEASIKALEGQKKVPMCCLQPRLNRVRFQEEQKWAMLVGLNVHLIKSWQYFQRSDISRTTREQDVLRWVPGFLHCMVLGCSYPKDGVAMSGACVRVEMLTYHQKMSQWCHFCCMHEVH